MKNLGLLFVGAWLIIASPAFAASEIVLQDGSRIRGEIVSMNNGLYKINTASMGTIELGSNQIKSISSAGSEGSSGDSSGPVDSAMNSLAESSMQSIQSSIANSPDLMSSIMALQNDPAMQAVLSDPEVMQAVQNLDFRTLQNHPKMKALMNNQKIREISGGLK